MQTAAQGGVASITLAQAEASIGKVISTRNALAASAATLRAPTDRGVKKRDLERHLTAHDCALVREGARHELWENRETGERSVVPRHREIKMPTARGIAGS